MNRLLNIALATAITAAVEIAGFGCAPAIAQNDPVKPQRMGTETSRSPAFKEEISRQEKIYQTPGENIPSGYVIDRSLLAYTVSLFTGFDRALAALGPGDRWLDVGADRGQAIVETLACGTPQYDVASTRVDFVKTQ